MDVKGNIVSPQSDVQIKTDAVSEKQTALPQAEVKPKELVSSEASLAARAYASPQVQFGKNISDLVYSELTSKKSPSQIKLSFSQVKTFLEQRLQLAFGGFHGSHAKFSKEGLPRPVIIAVHGNKELKPEVIKSLRNYVTSSPELAVN